MSILSEAQARADGVGGAGEPLPDPILKLREIKRPAAPSPAEPDVSARAQAAVADELDTVAALLAERGKLHGEFGQHARITQNLKGMLVDAGGSSNWEKLTAVQKEALEMIVHKIGRILAGNPDHRDHWDDICGYARLAADRVAL